MSITRMRRKREAARMRRGKDGKEAKRKANKRHSTLTRKNVTAFVSMRTHITLSV